MDGANQAGQQRDPYGFTLVELLVAIAILSVVITATYHSFSISMRVRETLRTRLDALDESRELADVLASDLRNLVPEEPRIAADDSLLVLLRFPRRAVVPETESDGEPEVSPRVAVVKYFVARQIGEEPLIVRQERLLEVGTYIARSVLEDETSGSDANLESGGPTIPIGSLEDARSVSFHGFKKVRWQPLGREGDRVGSGASGTQGAVAAVEVSLWKGSDVGKEPLKWIFWLPGVGFETAGSQ